MVLMRRPTDNHQHQPWDFIPCEFCLGFLHKESLSLHAKSCTAKPEHEQPAVNYTRNGFAILAPFLPSNTNDAETKYEMVVEGMKETSQNTGLKDICRSDTLIKEFGLSLLDRLGLVEEQRRKDTDNIRTKLRSVARLIKHLNNNKPNPKSLNEFITPGQFMNVVQAVKELSLNADSPSLSIALGNHIKHILLLKISLGIRSGDNNLKKEAVDFKELYEAHWNSKVSSIANRRKKLRALNKPIVVPATKDLVKFREFVISAIAEATKQPSPSYREWVELAQLTIARIVLFNKRRISEVEELKIDDFTKRSSCNENEDIMASLDVSERALVKR